MGQIHHNIHNFKIGDKVIVNDTLSEWVDREEWGQSMKRRIGKIFTIKKIDIDDDNGYETDRVYLIEDDGNFWFPIQCLDPIHGESKEEKSRIRWYKNGKLE